MKNKHYNSNNRAVINEFGVVQQITNYYPFGGVFSTTVYNRGDDLQPYKYNGKELECAHGLDWYDYGARNYDAIVPMFTSIDPLCEKYYHISPYAYCANNPVLLIDTDGREWKYSTDANGNIHISVDIKLNCDFLQKSINITEFKSALSSLFNEALSNASNGKITGEVTYSGVDVEGKVTPLMSLDSNADDSGGMTIGYFSNVCICDRDGNVKEMQLIASDALHELLHTLKLHHPFDMDYSDADDTKLIRIEKNDYKPTDKTDPNILYNVMSYKIITINGEKANHPQSLLTYGQIMYMLNQINQQQQGAGQSLEDPYWNNQH